MKFENSQQTFSSSLERLSLSLFPFPLMLSFNFSPYVLPEYKPRLLAYTYHGEDRSYIYKYFWRPLCTSSVNYLPRWLAPNVITVAGLAGVCIMHIILWWYIPDLTPSTDSNIPAWIFIASAVFLFLYQFLDNLDGHQARRTGSSSPLGLLMDHGCDAFNCVVGSISIASTVATGATWKTWAAMMAAVVVFFCNTWEEYYRGALILPVVNGPNEGLFVAIAIYLWTAFAGGPSWWLNTILIPVKWFPTSLHAFIVDLHHTSATTTSAVASRLLESCLYQPALWVADVFRLRLMYEFVTAGLNDFGVTATVNSVVQFVSSFASRHMPDGITFDWIRDAWNPLSAVTSVVDVLKDNIVDISGTRDADPRLLTQWIHHATRLDAFAPPAAADAIPLDPSSSPYLAVSLQFNTVAVCFMAAMGVITITGNFYQVYVAVSKQPTGHGKYGSSWLLRTFPFLHALTRLLPLLLITLLANVWFMHSSQDIFQLHPRVFCWTVGLLFTKLAIHLMIAHLCSTEFHPFRRTLIPFLYLAMHLTVSKSWQLGGSRGVATERSVSWFADNEGLILFEFFALSVVTFLHLVINASYEMATILDIRVFIMSKMKKG